MTGQSGAVRRSEGPTEANPGKPRIPGRFDGLWPVLDADGREVGAYIDHEEAKAHLWRLWHPRGRNPATPPAHTALNVSAPGVATNDPGAGANPRRSTHA
jgi:hypothetical protein